ncbi:ParB/RepB/Spo0J family partition protein [bacterium]|nr:ParB/RepB/Spo0J family partition protein [bacterium]
MATKRRAGLGRGLDALLSGGVESVEVSREDAEAEGTLREIQLHKIIPGKFQPRRDIDDEALESLAQSIRAQGVIQPIVVREAGKEFELIAGERRWRASKLAGLAVIPAVVKPMTDQVALAVALIENIQREALNPIEESLALKRLIDDCGLTHQECADSVGRSRAAVSNLLRLLELDTELQAMVRDGKLEMGHARAILGAPDDVRSAIAAEVVAKGLSVRQTEALVRAASKKGGQNKAKPDSNPAQLPDRLTSLGRTLGGRLNAKVDLQAKGKGAGQVVIRYDSLEQLESILSELT